MTIQEAINSGKPYKRSSWSSFCKSGDAPYNFSLTKEDILATDYTVFNPKVYKKKLNCTVEDLVKCLHKEEFARNGLSSDRLLWVLMQLEDAKLVK